MDDEYQYTRSPAWEELEPRGAAATQHSSAGSGAAGGSGAGDESSDSEGEQEGPQKLIRKVSTSGQIRSKEFDFATALLLPFQKAVKRQKNSFESVSFGRDSMTSVKEGLLLKQTSSFQRWKKRYFKLRGRTLYYAKDAKSLIFDEVDLSDASVAESSTKNVNNSFTGTRAQTSSEDTALQSGEGCCLSNISSSTGKRSSTIRAPEFASPEQQLKTASHNRRVITPFRRLILCAENRKEMEDWISSLKSVQSREHYETAQFNVEHFSGMHNWYACSHARPTFCNVCRDSLSGVTSHGLSCEVCKFKAHKRCAVRATNNCKWTTLASIGRDIIEDEDGIAMPHQWLEGNLPVSAKCAVCDKTCGSVLRLQDWRCLWCKAMVHTACMDLYPRKCPLGQCKVSIIPPTALNSIDSDGFWKATCPPSCASPLLVFVNSKSGDNQGVKFLRRFKQLLNPAQVFDLINGGPHLGLRLFQKFDNFRILVCGGDGSVGWVLSEIDKLNLHKQCQLGVLPLGTGNDLARVLGWGPSCDDDTQLPQILEKLERASTKMLDRWSIMTYEIKIPPKHSCPATPEEAEDCQFQISDYEDSVAAHLTKILNSDQHSVVISSAKILCETVKDFVARVGKSYEKSTENTDEAESMAVKCAVLNEKLDSLLQTLNTEAQAMSPPSLTTPPIVEEELEEEELEEEDLSEESLTELKEKMEENVTEKDSPHKLFRPREQLMLRANSLKKAVRQIIEQAEKMVDEQNAHTDEQDLQSPSDIKKDIEEENKDNEKDEDTKELESLPSAKSPCSPTERRVSRSTQSCGSFSIPPFTTSKENLPVLNTRIICPGLRAGLAASIAGSSIISKMLLANIDPFGATPFIDPDPDSLEGYLEKCVMNNYFGIGLDAKISLEFNNKREEHPEKCRSRTKNMMWYGVLGTKELLQRTYKNLEQKVQLECDGQYIPLPSLQGIAVLNIPSYAGGTNFWGGTKEDDLLGGKAAGVDEIRPEYLKSLDVVGLSWLTCLCNIAGITLLSLPGKVYSRVLERRVRLLVKPQIQEEQCGFRPSRGTLDQLYILHRVLEGSWEFAQPVYMCLVDLKKAFDRVPRGILWEVLWEISRRSQGLEGVRFGDHRISSLIFADDVVLLAPSSLDLQLALGRFATECEAAGMSVSTSKSEAMVLDRKKVACTLQVGGELLPQVEEFKYLGVLFTSEGRMDREIDRRIGAAAAVMRSMYRSVVVKKELSRKAKLSIYQSIYIPTLTYGHELWVMTERVRSRIQAAEMSFLLRVAGRSLRDRVRSSATQEELRVEPLLLHIERGQLRWLGHLFRMPLGRLPGEVFRACPTGKRPRGRPRTRWRDYVSRLAWERLGVPPEELEEVSGEREIFCAPSFDDKILEVVAVFGSMQMAVSRVIKLQHHRIAQCRTVKITILGDEGVPIQVDGEAWIQPPGVIKIQHKNRAQMLTRDRAFENTLKSWEDKLKYDKPPLRPHLYSQHSVDLATEEEAALVQMCARAAEELITRICEAAKTNGLLEQELAHAVNAASHAINKTHPKFPESLTRNTAIEVTSTVKALHNETESLLVGRVSLQLEPPDEELLSSALQCVEVELGKLTEIPWLYHILQPNDEEDHSLEYGKRNSRSGMFRIVPKFKKEKALKKSSPQSVQRWGTEEVGAWLEQLSLGEYKDTFIRHDIRGSELLHLERRDLKDLGISKVGHMKRILQGTKELAKSAMVDL
ncbi:hypothetical protein QTP70_027204 [Hemibagrus guttatus]|uniref:Diacylglycerol kinase n=1 Tax=Hemibagrus guttatus TaxID=175788 RepID=A0AAE0V7Z8_9TELE|nr:hypothetical protein QTP70_027204 [Hemibagrus guttatus]